MKPQQGQICKREIAQAIDETTIEQFRKGTDFGYGIGFDDGLREAAVEPVEATRTRN